MKNLILASVGAASLALGGCATTMDGDMDDGDMAMAGTTITQTVVDSPNHTTLEQLVVSAGLADTLNGAGPFTVFAPVDDAFTRVPAATRTALMQPSNREMLRGVLTYHVVSGNVSSADLIAQIRSGGGTASLTTVQGTALTASLENGNVKLTDATGGIAYVTNPDMVASNGVIHSINGVLMPRN